MSGDLIVLKFGGSVLRDELHVRAVAEEVAGCVRRGSRVVAVVSALEGTTDALLAKAAAYSSSPNPFATAQLLATGELASAALLGLALDSIGVRAETLDAAGAGFRTEGEPLDSSPVAVDLPGVVDALGRVRAVVVPGFVGRDERGRTTVLGRGGSDLTALFLAQRLGGLVPPGQGRRRPLRVGPLAPRRAAPPLRDAALGRGPCPRWHDRAAQGGPLGPRAQAGVRGRLAGRDRSLARR
ncbi:MAG: hypothetical protein HND58_02625 [Planctomycetota bacterium]|nr:MAG: hypothetical protein HND58_02625 [Planctomycetota bacterium]